MNLTVLLRPAAPNCKDAATLEKDTRGDSLPD